MDLHQNSRLSLQIAFIKSWQLACVNAGQTLPVVNIYISSCVHAGAKL